MRESAYPWGDEPSHVETRYRRTWRGMPLRSEWNASPSLLHCRTCAHCGYKWDQHDFTYRGGARVNGQEPPVMVHEVCWNCFMVETKPGEVEACWGSLERKATGTTRAPELRALGGGR